LKEERTTPGTTAHFQINRQPAACFPLGCLLGGLWQKLLLYKVGATSRGHSQARRKPQPLSVDSGGFPVKRGRHQRQGVQRESLEWDTAA